MRFSLRKKTIVLVISITVIIGLVAVVIFNDTINDIIQTQYKERSIDIANLVSLEVDPVRHGQEIADSLLKMLDGGEYVPEMHIDATFEKGDTA